jgi:hypothetical protein
MSDGRIGIECTMYQPGHQVHWMQVISASLPRHPRRARIVSITGALITIDVDRQERRFRNHATRELRSFVDELGPYVVLDEPRILLEVLLSDHESQKCFSIVGAGKPLHRCRFDQLTQFDPDSLARRSITDGGFSVPAQLVCEHLGGHSLAGAELLDEVQRRHLVEDTFGDLLDSGK